MQIQNNLYIDLMLILLCLFNNLENMLVMVVTVVAYYLGNEHKVVRSVMEKITTQL